MSDVQPDPVPEVQRLHGQAMRWIFALALGIGLGVYLVLSTLSGTSRTVLQQAAVFDSTRDSIIRNQLQILRSLKEAKDSSAIQRARIAKELDQLRRRH